MAKLHEDKRNYTNLVERSIKIQRNKRYGWLLFFTLLNWATIILMILFVDPDTMKDLIVPNSYLLMGMLLFCGVFWIFSIIFLSAVRALKWAVAVIFFLYLRLWGLGTIVNGLLVLGIVISWEIFSSRHKTNQVA